MNNPNTDNFFSQMPESEIKTHKKVFSRISLAAVIYLLLSELLVFAVLSALRLLAPSFMESYTGTMLVSYIVLYAVGVPVFYLFLRSLPKLKPKDSPLGVKTLLGFMLVGVFIMYVGNVISQWLMTFIEGGVGRDIENGLEQMLNSSGIIFNLLVVGIIGPIFEELMFRKLIIDRLSSYNSVVAIVFSSLLFALFHGNLYQLFYAFALGVVLAFLYIRTGRLRYSIILHCFINLFCGVLPSFILSKLDLSAIEKALETGAAALTDQLLPLAIYLLYDVAMLAMVIAGFIIFVRKTRSKSIQLPLGRVTLPCGRAAEIMLFNPGTVIFFILCITVISLNTFL